MSAYLVNPEHIAALAAFYTRNNQYADTVLIATTLAKANIKSIRARYGARAEETRPKAAAEYTRKACMMAEFYAKNKPALGPMDYIAMAQCFDYQACEVNKYDRTPAATITSRIISDAIYDLPGRDNAVRDYSDNQFYEVK